MYLHYLTANNLSAKMVNYLDIMLYIYIITADYCYYRTGNDNNIIG